MTDNRFVGPVLGAGWETIDRRRIGQGFAGEHRDLPLPLMQADPSDGHESHGPIGWITNVWVDDDGVCWIEGTTSLPPGEYQVGAEVADIEYDFDGGDAIDYMAGQGVLVFTKARLAAVAVRSNPAFPNARITVDVGDAGITPPAVGSVTGG